MPLFETYIFVDWSAHKKLGPRKPSKDSIWVGELTGSSNKPSENYFRSRRECYDHLVDRLLNHFKHNRLILLGFDFAYGYPSGFASALELPTEKGDAWWKIWNVLSASIEDDYRK
jgi:molybdopterin molybdotransferase